MKKTSCLRFGFTSLLKASTVRGPIVEKWAQSPKDLEIVAKLEAPSDGASQKLSSYTLQDLVVGKKIEFTQENWNDEWSTLWEENRFARIKLTFELTMLWISKDT